MEWIINVIGIAAVGALWINSEPTIKLRDIILKKENWLKRLLECAMCSTFHIYFWWQLIFFSNLDIMGAALSAVIAELINQKLNDNVKLY
jgi:hypothetical protein